VFVTGDAAADLTALQEEFFVWNEQQAPEFATDVGATKQFNDILANLSMDVFDPRMVRLLFHSYIKSLFVVWGFCGRMGGGWVAVCMCVCLCVCV
jgi:hypothetical protein